MTKAELKGQGQGRLRQAWKTRSKDDCGATGWRSHVQEKAWKSMAKSGVTDQVRAGGTREPVEVEE